jgi:hypothetical protein
MNVQHLQFLLLNAFSLNGQHQHWCAPPLKMNDNRAFICSSFKNTLIVLDPVTFTGNAKPFSLA